MLFTNFERRGALLLSTYRARGVRGTIAILLDCLACAQAHPPKLCRFSEITRAHQTNDHVELQIGLATETHCAPYNFLSFTHTDVVLFFIFSILQADLFIRTTHEFSFSDRQTNRVSSKKFAAFPVLGQQKFHTNNSNNEEDRRGLTDHHFGT